MHWHIRFRPMLSSIAAAALWLAVGLPAQADTVFNYVFTGVGNGTVDATPWSGSFTFTFTAPTSNITSGGGEFFQSNIGGTVSEGAFSGTLLSNNAVVVNNDPAFPRGNFFNSTFDNGGTIQNPSFTAYQLATAFGPVTAGTGPNLLPTLNSLGHGFGTTGGHTFELLGITSLTFSASVPAVPEPLSFALIATGLTLQLGFFRPWRKTNGG